MLTDVAGLSFALAAIWLAQRPATARKTFGYYRVEVLAALLNGLLLFGVAAYILFEGYQRFTDPPDVPGIPLLIVASIGLAANLVSATALWQGAGESLNVQGAFLETVGDLLGSIGAIIAGVILLTTGWKYAYPLFAVGVGLLILPRTWKLMSEAVNVLLEGTPKGIDFAQLERAMRAVAGVRSVHDLHVWTVTSGFIALSGHIGVDNQVRGDRVLLELRQKLVTDFDIEHVTLQLETESLEQELDQSCLPQVSGCYAPESVAPGDRVGGSF